VACAVRYFNVYGPRQNPLFVISQSIHRILNGSRPFALRFGRLASDSKAPIGEAFNIGSTFALTYY
jgi:UDP-glucose 4-epimerase